MLQRVLAVTVVLLHPPLFLGADPPDSPPAAERRRVENVYHGVTVVDDYQWLEDAEDKEVQAWSDEQNRYARGYLGQLPAIEQIRNRVTDILSARFVSYRSIRWRNGVIFALKAQPPKPHPILVLLKSTDDLESEHVLLDPGVFDPSGETSIDWYVPSFDGSLVAVSLSKRGSESGDVHIFDTETARRLDDVIPRVNGGTAGGDLTWTADGSGFFYTRYPREGERPGKDLDFFQQVFYHKLGTPSAEDTYEIGEQFPRIAEVKLQSDAKAERVLATVQDGDSGRFAHYLRSSSGRWLPIADYDDEIVQATFGPANSLYLVSRKGAPRGCVLRLDLDEPDLKSAETVIPQSQDVIVHDFWGPSPLLSTPDFLFVTYQLGGPSELRVFDHDGRGHPGPKLFPVSSVGGLTKLAGNEILVQNTSYLQPGSWVRFDPTSGRTRETELSTRSPVNLEDVEVVREFATSKDGTSVPINIMRPKEIELDGTNPVVVMGYGGYGISMSPYYFPVGKVLLEQGVVYAIANLRGGGEFGEEWHEQGRLTNKQNVFDDFATVLRHVVKRGYTSPDRLGIVGASNGGLLMGAMITQHPDLFQAAVAMVGLYDMLRVELAPNGKFNVPEFGSVTVEDQFHALYSYSPYHNVEDGVECPAVLFSTGDNDPRVDPMHSRKMTARLQAATASSAPILLRTSEGIGHWQGTPFQEKIALYVDQFAFLFHQLGVEYDPVEE